MKQFIDFISKNIVIILSPIVALIIILIMSKKTKTSSASTKKYLLSSSVKVSQYNMDNDQNGNLKANNPGNIRDASGYEFKGQTGKDYRGFCTFSSFEYGLRAMIKLLWTYNQKGYKTIAQIINRYAPPVENDTRHYAEFVSKDSGIALNTPLNWSDFNDISKVISAMCQMENSIRPTALQFVTAWELANDGQSV